MSSAHLVVRELRTLWPRRASGLPPGQRVLDAFPRFADDPRRPPPVLPPAATLRVTSFAGNHQVISHEELQASNLVESRASDFHCVTTWTARGQTWTGVPLAAWWRARVEPGTPRTPPYAVVRGFDGYQAVFERDDLFADDVMLVWKLDHRPLDLRHGFPLRLISPSQYGYKSVKHVESIELCEQQPVSLLGAKEHPRARVAAEERHSRLPARLLRWPYRILVPITAVVAERTLNRVVADTSGSLRSRLPRAQQKRLR